MDSTVMSGGEKTPCEETPNVHASISLQHMGSLDNQFEEDTPQTEDSENMNKNNNHQRWSVTQNTVKKKTTLQYPRAGNSQLSIGERVASEPLEVRVSKALAAGLRHGKLGFEIDQEGFVHVDFILNQPYFQKLKVDFNIISRIVEQPYDNVKRFYMARDNVGAWKIRALQGHTVNIQKLDLVPVTLDDTMQMPFVIHGTFWKAWEKIKTSGLKLVLGKQYLHFQAGKLGSSTKELVQNFRHNCEVLVYIDLAKALQFGICFWRSNNNVIITQGDNHNRISARFFLKAVHISPTTGEQIWVETLGNDDFVSGNKVIDGLDDNTMRTNEPIKKRGPNPHPSGSLSGRSRQNSTNSYKGRSRPESQNLSRSRPPSVNVV